MPTATEASERILIKCDHPGCPWEKEGPRGKETQIRGMHKAKVHGYQSTHPSTMRQAAIRRGEELPQQVLTTVKKTTAGIADYIARGLYRPGQQLMLARLASTHEASSTHNVRQALYALSRTDPPLVHRENGAFYVGTDVQPADAAEALATTHRRRAGRPAGLTLVDKIADQIREQLGTKYPLGSTLPTGLLLAKEFETSESTVARAIKVHKDEGLLDYRGNVVALPTTGEVVEPEPTAPAPSADSKRPTVREHITSQILDGTYPVGSVLPSEAKMASVMGGTRQAMEGTYFQIKQAGLIEHRAEGWVVIHTQPVPASAESKRDMVYRHLRDGIRSGEYQPNRPLPSRDKLAKQLMVGPTTVDLVVARLEGEGFVLVNPRAGAIVLPESERGTFNAPKPTVGDEEDEDQNFVMNLVKGMLVETRRSWAAVDELKAKVKELEARPDDKATVLSLQGDVTRLQGKLKEATEGLDKMRGVMHRKEEENADLRGELHRRKRNGFASFGPDVKQTIGTALGLREGELARIMQSPREQ